MIHDIRLQSFRSYQDDTFEFDKGVNIIVGPNASGKTNLLEAILYSCIGVSYRVSASGLIRFGDDWARLETHTDIGARIVKIDARGHTLTPQKTYDIDGQQFVRLPASKTTPVVLFEPDHLRLLHGSPEARRTYLDDLLEQTTPGYGRVRRGYKRALAQRNALLKYHQHQHNSQLFAWNVRLSQLGGQIAEARHQLVRAIDEATTPLYKELSASNTSVQLHYHSTTPLHNYESHLLKQLEAGVDQDVQRGFTLHGPHRDDMLVTFDEHEAQTSASRGEVRTVLLSMKVVELQLLERLRNQAPLLLLDDVFSELDGARRQALTRYLSKYQTFITTTDADVVVQHFMDKCRIIPTSHD